MDITERIELALDALKLNMQKRNRKHGDGGHASVHESLGILVEEMDEFRGEVRHDNSTRRQYEELCDIATAAVVGMASLAYPVAVECECGKLGVKSPEADPVRHLDQNVAICTQGRQWVATSREEPCK